MSPPIHLAGALRCRAERRGGQSRVQPSLAARREPPRYPAARWPRRLARRGIPERAASPRPRADTPGNRRPGRVSQDAVMSMRQLRLPRKSVTRALRLSAWHARNEFACLLRATRLHAQIADNGAVRQNLTGHSLDGTSPCLHAAEQSRFDSGAALLCDRQGGAVGSRPAEPARPRRRRSTSTATSGRSWPRTASPATVRTKRNGPRGCARPPRIGRQAAQERRNGDRPRRPRFQ